MSAKRLLLLTLFPPPDGFDEVHARMLEQSEPHIVLLAGEGVLNMIRGFPDTYTMMVDLEGRGIMPDDRSLSDNDAALLILSASSVITFT